MTTGLRLKHVAKVDAGQSPSSSDVVPFDGEGMPFLQGNAEFGGQYPTAVHRCDSAPRIADAGALLVSVRAPVGAVNIADQRYGIGRGLAAVRPRAIHARYAYWLLLSSAGWLNSIATGSTFTAISGGDLGNVSVLVTNEREQRAIADYLDRETAQIDAFIAKNEELITLLTERRASVLSAAMGEGSPRMRLRQVLSVAQTGPFGTQLSASEYIDDGVPVINPSHIVEGAIAHDPGVSVSVERASELSRFRLSPDDIVLGRKGEVDKAALVDDKSDGYLCGSDSMMLRPSRNIVDPKYLWWFLQSPPAHEQLERFAVGSTVVGLNQRTLRVVQLPVPSIETQKAITADLNRATVAISSAISVAKRSVRLARERRAALISAAVTGKIDVGVTA